jgi:hypothetical protein
MLVRAPSRLRAHREAGVPTDVDVLLRRGGHALYEEGDLWSARVWFGAAHRAAEQAGDAVALGETAVGLAGLWPGEHRDPVGAAVQVGRIRRALAGLNPASPLGLRLRLRLAAMADQRHGVFAATQTLADEARRRGDPVACAEAANLLHYCMLGPDQAAERYRLAEELIAHDTRCGRRLGLMWRTVDLFADGDARAATSLSELRTMLAARRHLAIGLVADAIDVMLDIRAGRLAQAEVRSGDCAWQAAVAGDTDAEVRHSTQLVAIYWYRGRIGELVPMLGELAGAPGRGPVDPLFLSMLAMAAAAAGDQQQARGALARLRGLGLADLPRGGTWLATLHAAGEAAFLLGDRATARQVYDLLMPYAGRPVTIGLGTACFGSAQHVLGVAALTVGNLDRAVAHLSGAVAANLALGHLPATALARGRLAEALDPRALPGAITQARPEGQIAAQNPADSGVARPAGDLPAPGEGRADGRGTTRRYGAQPATCRRRGQAWELTLGNATTRVRHSRGIQYLAVLIANPGQEIRAMELAAGPGHPADASHHRRTGPAQPILDDVAKREYRGRMAQLREQIEACESQGNLARADQIRGEHDWILAELATATGLGGRPRTFATDDERARIAVGKAIRRTLDHITRADRALGEHLRDAVHTGNRCSYRPY